MTNQHPIKPSQEQLQQWMFDLHFSVPHPDYGQMDAQPHWMELVERVAQWAANQELEACCEWLRSQHHSDTWPNRIRAARRPKPPSDKEMALAELDRLIALIPTEGAMAMAEPIRKVLEALPND